MNRTEINQSARKRSVEILVAHEQSRTSLRYILRNYLKESHDDFAVKNQVQFLTIGAIRHKNTIDYLLARGDPTLSLKKLGLEDLNRLRLALFESRWLDEDLMTVGTDYLKWRTHLRSVLQTSYGIDLEKSLESASLVSRLSVRYSHPTFIIETLLEHFDEKELVEHMKANQTPPISYIRPNLMLDPNRDVISNLISNGVSLVADESIADLYVVKDDISNLIQTDEFRDGRVLIHDKASILAAEALDPRPGDFIWDACAAPGMKTQLICERMLNKGKLVASDISRRRLNGAAKRFETWACSFAEWILADAIESPIIGAKKILIDAPCTSTGMLQSHPSYKWRLNKNWLFSLMAIQNKLLEGIISTYSHLPGTEIVYSTCSILPHEGESQIDSVLDSFSLTLLDIPGIEEPGYSGFRCSSEVRRLYPHKHRTNGFFIARFRID